MNVTMILGIWHIRYCKYQVCVLDPYCKKTEYQAIEYDAFSYFNLDIFISSVYSVNDSKEFNFKSCQIKDFQVIPDISVSFLHSFSGKQKTCYRMLSTKPLSHSIQQQMLFLTFTKKHCFFFFLLPFYI